MRQSSISVKSSTKAESKKSTKSCKSTDSKSAKVSIRQQECEGQYKKLEWDSEMKALSGIIATRM